jgi:hypothetical protein
MPVVPSNHGANSSKVVGMLEKVLVSCENVPVTMRMAASFSLQPIDMMGAVTPILPALPRGGKG